MSNLTKLKDLKTRYNVGNMEIADLIGYSYDGVNAWFRSTSSTTLRTLVLEGIESALARKYPER